MKKSSEGIKKIMNRKLVFIFFVLGMNTYFVAAQKTNPKTQKPVTTSQKTEVNEYAETDRKALLLPDSLTATTDNIAAFITNNFNTDKEKVRAIFIWIATNIQYDVDNMFAINFYEKKEDKITKPLKTRKGICENYAALFTDICLKAGIKSYMVEGYTKQNGFTDYIPHAWCAAMVDSAWFLFDPTWGSGYINSGKFVKKINNDYFKARPSYLIKSHIPFDYLWQFLNYPVTNQEFYEGKTEQDKSKPYFNYQDSIIAYDNLSHIDQLSASAIRIEANGVRNSMIFDRLHHIKAEIENIRQNQIVSLYNSAVSDYNDAINYYNDFIQYRNKQFTPKKTDPEIQSMIDVADDKVKASRKKLKEIKDPDANISSSMMQLTKSLDEISTHIQEQQDWLKIYFSKGKAGRKNMFYDRKVSWFGIPLN